MPTAVPTMPDSARGESMTRSSPKSFCSPSVIRKTPPSLPTSSPMIRTFGSSSMALRSPMLSALPSVVGAMSVTSHRVEGLEIGRVRVAVLDQPGRVFDVHVVEERQRRRVGHLLRLTTDPAGELVGLGLDRGIELVVGLGVV